MQAAGRERADTADKQQLRSVVRHGIPYGVGVVVVKGGSPLVVLMLSRAAWDLTQVWWLKKRRAAVLTWTWMHVIHVCTVRSFLSFQPVLTYCWYGVVGATRC